MTEEENSKAPEISEIITKKLIESLNNSINSGLKKLLNAKPSENCKCSV